MRFAAVSDIHGNLAALEAVAADIRRRGADFVVNLGDSLSGPLLPLETAQFLMAAGWPSLAGNHERQLLTCPPSQGDPADDYARDRLGKTELAWIASLPPVRRLPEDILLCHGTPASDCTYLLESPHQGVLSLASPADIACRLGSATAPALVVCGHSHAPRSVRLPNGPCIVNPGSVGLQAFSDERPAFHIMATGSPDARYALLERHASQWSAAQVTVPYNHAAMALLARQGGFPEWEAALSHGFLS